MCTCFSTPCDPWKSFNRSPFADLKGKQECAHKGPKSLTTSGKCNKPCTLDDMWVSPTYIIALMLWKNTYHRGEWIGSSSVSINLNFHPNHSCSLDPLGEGTHLLPIEGDDDSKHHVKPQVNNVVTMNEVHVLNSYNNMTKLHFIVIPFQYFLVWILRGVLFTSDGGFRMQRQQSSSVSLLPMYQSFLWCFESSHNFSSCLQTPNSTRCI